MTAVYFSFFSSHQGPRKCSAGRGDAPAVQPIAQRNAERRPVEPGLLLRVDTSRSDSEPVFGGPRPHGQSAVPVRQAVRPAHPVRILQAGHHRYTVTARLGCGRRIQRSPRISRRKKLHWP